MTIDNVTGTKKILQTLIPAPEITMGDLLLAWGTPTGFIQDDEGVYVYWNERKAYLVDCLFWPGSHIESITFYPKAITVPPWQGFVRRQNSACPAISKAYEREWIGVEPIAARQATRHRF